jgi:hypothetical protein
MCVKYVSFTYPSGLSQALQRQRKNGRRLFGNAVRSSQDIEKKAVSRLSEILMNKI